jgi:uncharacterized membrane protein YsdA (DUF1294 family)/cold shock CspA family protein
MRYQGRLIEWNDDRGFGFIEPNGGGERVFLHVNSLRGARARPVLGQVFNYTLGKDERGRRRVLIAETLPIAARRRAAETRQGSSAWRLQAGAVGLLVQAVLAVLSGIPTALLSALAVMNLLAFGAYWLDKRAARAGAQRTPENHLHLFALLGGWPAGLIAQRWLRHKSLKQPFQALFWITVVVNFALLIALVSPQGQAALRGFLGANS